MWFSRLFGRARGATIRSHDDWSYTMYKTIVLALDESEGAADALPHAVNLARRDAATLVIAHARTHALEISQEAMLEQTVEGLRSGGIDAVLEIRTSLVEEVASFLGDVATEANADLIVIAGRGRSALAGAVLGSVTQRLLHVAPCPVLVVPMHTDVATGKAGESAASGATR
jgi:nucleotide-binding universal stress UspA family protein